MTLGRSPDTPPHPLLERETALAAAREAVARLRSGEPGGNLLVIEGDAGLGKTCLLNEVARLAADCAVWGARGGEAVTPVPFHIIRQLLGPALLGLTEEEGRAYLGDRYDIAGPALGLTSPSGPYVDPQGVRDGVIELGRRVAQRDWPLVLLVDDAHWADLESLHWLSAFAERLDEIPALVVVAHRPVRNGAEARLFLDRLAVAAGPRFRLDELSPAATAALSRELLGEHADDAFCREVWAVTAGNPYDTVELLTKAQESDVEPVESSAGALRAMNESGRDQGLVTRLTDLGPDTTRYAWAAAVLGARITSHMAGALAGVEGDEADACVARLRKARILKGGETGVGGVPAGHLEFVHPVVASAVYRSIPAALRTAMHGQAAWAVTKSGQGPAVAARHLLEVYPDDDADVVRQLREAAREHLAVGAPEAARRCLERALVEPPLPEIHAHVLYELGCATLLTSPQTTVEHLREALSMPGLEGSLRTDAVSRLSQALVHNDQLEEAVGVLGEAIDEAEPGPERLRLQAMHYMWRCIRAAEEDSTERSRSLAELVEPLTGRDNSERALLILRAFDAMTHGENAQEVLERCDKALVNGRLAPGLGWTDSEWSFELLVMLGASYLFADRIDRAESLFTEALRVYEAAGWSGGHLAVAHAFVGYVHRRRGRLNDAEGMLREALRLADRVGSGLPMHWDAACMLIDTLLARGKVQEASRVAEDYGFEPPYPSTLVLPDAHSVRGRLLLAAGRRSEGIAELEAAEKAVGGRGRHNTVMAPWAGDLALALNPDQPERAAGIAAVARTQAERFGTDTAIGEALRCAAQLETGQRAVTLLSQAVTYLESSPSAYEHARARVEYGIAARSVAELTRGLTLALSCGADGLAARARSVLDSGRGLN